MRNSFILQIRTDTKHFKHHIFIGALPFHLVQLANTEFLLMRTHVLNRLRKGENVQFCKNQVFLWFYH